MLRLFFIVACVSRAFSVLCVYLKFGHHPHPLATYVQISFLSQPPLLSWMMEKNRVLSHLTSLPEIKAWLIDWLNESITQSLTQLIWCYGNWPKRLRFEKSPTNTCLTVATSYFLLQTRLSQPLHPPTCLTQSLVNLLAVLALPLFSALFNARRTTGCSSKITNRSSHYDDSLPCLWNKRPVYSASINQPSSTSSLLPSPLSSSATPSRFHSRLQKYLSHKSASS